MTGPAPERIDAVVLAGGLGTRLRSVVSDRPKPMAEVGGRPFLDLVLRNLRGVPGIGTVVLAVSHMAERIVEEYADRSDLGFRIDFSVETTPLGTGGAIRNALSKARASTLVVTNGDTFVEVGWEALLRAHRDARADLTVVLRMVDDAGRFGRVETDSRGRIVAFHEKGPAGSPGRINAGVYVLARAAIERLPDGVPASLEKDVVPDLLARGSIVCGFPTDGRFIDIGIPESYRGAADYLRDHLGGGER